MQFKILSCWLHPTFESFLNLDNAKQYICLLSRFVSSVKRFCPNSWCIHWVKRESRTGYRNMPTKLFLLANNFMHWHATGQFSKQLQIYLRHYYPVHRAPLYQRSFMKDCHMSWWNRCAFSGLKIFQRFSIPLRIKSRLFHMVFSSDFGCFSCLSLFIPHSALWILYSSVSELLAAP